MVGVTIPKTIIVLFLDQRQKISCIIIALRPLRKISIIKSQII